MSTFDNGGKMASMIQKIMAYALSNSGYIFHENVSGNGVIALRCSDYKEYAFFITPRGILVFCTAIDSEDKRSFYIDEESTSIEKEITESIER